MLNLRRARFILRGMKIATEAELDAYLRACSHALHLQDLFFGTGHDHNTHNATATFIKCAGHYYVCTAHHVPKLTHEPEVVRTAPNPVAALMIRRSVINFSLYPGKPLTYTFHSPACSHAETPVDISIASVDDIWGTISTLGNKVPIDLDACGDPPLSDIQMCVAFGYENEGKALRGNSIIGTRTLLGVNMASTPYPDWREFTLCSTLAAPHGHFFSGLSGGPILAQTRDKEFYPIGIIQEASPSSSKNERTQEAFTSPNDIVVRGIVLTRERFLNWVSLTPLSSKYYDGH